MTQDRVRYYFYFHFAAMEPTTIWLSAATDKPVKVSKWKVKAGSKVGRGALLCIYDTEDTKGLKLKSTMVGTVVEVVSATDFLPKG